MGATNSRLLIVAIPDYFQIPQNAYPDLPQQFIRKIANIVTVLHQGKILTEDTMANIQQNQTVLDVYLGQSGRA